MFQGVGPICSHPEGWARRCTCLKATRLPTSVLQHSAGRAQASAWESTQGPLLISPRYRTVTRSSTGAASFLPIATRYSVSSDRCTVTRYGPTARVPSRRSRSVRLSSAYAVMSLSSSTSSRSRARSLAAARIPSATNVTKLRPAAARIAIAASTSSKATPRSPERMHHSSQRVHHDHLTIDDRPTVGRAIRKEAPRHAIDPHQCGPPCPNRPRPCCCERTHRLSHPGTLQSGDRQSAHPDEQAEDQEYRQQLHQRDALVIPHWPTASASRLPAAAPLPRTPRPPRMRGSTRARGT